jgi:mRNA-degrading endonuclease RelE of RelBE toxin-antitoxin system
LRYEVVFLNTFLKQFKKLPGNVKERVKQRTQDLATNPYLGLRLTGGLEGFWKDRLGAYRIIYKIDTKAGRIIFYIFESGHQLEPSFVWSRARRIAGITPIGVYSV